MFQIKTRCLQSRRKSAFRPSLEGLEERVALTADLGITKAGAPSTVFVGGYVNYTLIVTNFGPDTATGVTVTDSVPTGATFITAGTTRGSFSFANGTITANIGTMTSQATATITIIARATTEGVISNVASVTGTSSDSNSGNNTSTPVMTTVNPTPVGPTTDLSAVTTGPSTGTTGQNLTYTVTVTNLGTNADPSPVLVDILPLGTTFVSATLSPASQSAGSVTFNLSSLAASGSTTVMVTVKPSLAGNITNQAGVEGSIPDTNPLNNLSIFQTTVAGVVVTPEVPVVQAPSVVLFARSGVYSYPATINVTFDSPLDPTTAQNIRNYTLTQQLGFGGPRFRFRVQSARYNPSTNSVRVRFNGTILLFAQYVFTINGASATGVTGADGTPIDGAGTGQPGTNYVQAFSTNIRFGRRPPIFFF
jgi:uncharacterized repeat protein (TIGR01451 family)